MNDADILKYLRLFAGPDYPAIIGKKVMALAADRIEQLEAALQSIAANTCCDKCQEAALVARAALAGEKKDDGTS